MRGDAIKTLNDWNPEWIESEGFYKARVHLGDSDYALVSACADEQARHGFGLLMEIYEVLMAQGPGADESNALTAVREHFDASRRNELWTLLDDIIASSLVEWHVPELSSLPAFHAEPPVPNTKLDAPERAEILGKLPISVKLRLAAGVFWQLKNSLGGSRPPAQA